MHRLAVDLDALEAGQSKAAIAHPNQMRLVQRFSAPHLVFPGRVPRYLHCATYALVPHVEHFQHARPRHVLAQLPLGQVDALVPHFDDSALHAAYCMRIQHF